jgi:hypothetical protein
VLPKTADQLLGVPQGDILLGANATSASPLAAGLADYRL